MEHCDAAPAMSVYREFAPCHELRDYVRALAWYGPASNAVGLRAPIRELYVDADRELTPSFADAHTSLLFPLGVSYGRNGWEPSAAIDATVMGAMTHVTQPPAAERSAMIGVYLRPRGRVALLGIPATELTDRIVSLNDVWKGFALPPALTSLEMVEALLARRVRVASPPPRAVRFVELAAYVSRCGGRVSVSRMADLAGLSRQHLGRLFLEYVGVSPKRYTRLTRFRATVGHLGDHRCPGGWSGFAERFGYADQSHLIADFREFTAFSPLQLARGDHFHPFIAEER